MNVAQQTSKYNKRSEAISEELNT